MVATSGQTVTFSLMTRLTTCCAGNEVPFFQEPRVCAALKTHEDLVEAVIERPLAGMQDDVRQPYSPVFRIEFAARGHVEVGQHDALGYGRAGRIDEAWRCRDIEHDGAVLLRAFPGDDRIVGNQVFPGNGDGRRLRSPG